MRRITFAIVAAAALSWPGSAAAMQEQELGSRIAAAQRAEPAAFRALRGIVAQIEGQPLRTDRIRSLAGELRALGAGGLYPMLEFLQPGSKGLAALRSSNAERATRFEALLFDALGNLRDPLAAETLQAGLGRSDPGVAAAAARGLGKLCRQEDLAFLAAHENIAAIEGLGFCRRPETGVLLGERLQRGDTGAVARAAGNWGSSWAWQAQGVEASAASAAMRREVARALVRALARPDAAPETRKDLVRALLLLDLPETPALAGEIEGQAPESAALLRSRWERAHRRSAAPRGISR